jgi:putative phosphoesterase
MRIAALFDIHGNLPALEAVINSLASEQIDAVVVGGDTAWGPQTGECLDRLAALPQELHWVIGNCDREVLDTRAGGVPASEMVQFTAEHLTDRHFDLLRRSQPTVTLSTSDEEPLLFCHGSPRADTDVITRISPAARVLPMLVGTNGIVIGGHTHQQFDRTFDGRRFLNGGSVGLPYEGEPDAYWLLIGDDFEMRQTSYNADEAIDAMRATGFPSFDPIFGDALIAPVSPEEATKALEEQAASADSD